MHHSIQFGTLATPADKRMCRMKRRIIQDDRPSSHHTSHHEAQANADEKHANN